MTRDDENVGFASVSLSQKPSRSAHAAAERRVRRDGCTYAASVSGQWQVVPEENGQEDPHKLRSADLRRVGRLAVVILVVVASMGSSTALCGVSSPTGAMTVARAGHTATLLRSGKVLVAGGWVGSPNPQVTSSAELYDPTTGRWTVTGSMKSGRASHAAVLLRSGKVLVVGGTAPGEDGAPPSAPPFGATASAEVYDSDSGIWTETSSLPFAGDILTAIVLQSGKVFVAPWRYGPNAVTTPAELYDPVSKSWSVIGGLIQPFGSATLLASGKVLVVNGVRFSDAPQLYDPATGAWALAARMITNRGQHTATLLPSGKVLVVGGVGLDTQTPAEIYDPATDMWTPTSPMSTPHDAGAEATLLPFGKVLVAGGGSGAPGPKAVDSVDLYDPATARWTASGVMATARTFFTATLLPSGALLFAGGADAGDGLFSSAEIYAPTCLSR
jgi:Kelch motif protein/galactose oxidase-like protein